MTKPLVSVLIPTRNGAAYIQETILSAVAQTVSDIEIIVYDGESTDETRDIVQQLSQNDPRIHLLPGQHLGIGGARNAAFQASSSEEYLLFLDHDDILEPRALEVLTQALRESPSSPAAYGKVRVIDQIGAEIAPGSADTVNLGLTRRRLQSVSLRGALSPLTVCQDDEPTDFVVLLAACPITSVGQVLFRRDQFERAGGFDPRSAPADDWDLYIRLSRIASLLRVDEITLEWRLHSANTSGNRHLMIEALNRLRRKIVRSGLTKAEKKTVVYQALHDTLAYFRNMVTGDRSAGFRTHVLPSVSLLFEAMLSRPMSEPRR